MNSAQRSLLDWITSGWISQAIGVAAELSIADHLNDGPLDAETLAKRTKVDAGGLTRLLYALSTIDIFSREDDGRFSLTPMSEFLKSDKIDSLKGSAQMLSSSWYRAISSELLRSVRTGKPVFEHVLGVSLFNFLAQNPEAAEVFDSTQTGYVGMSESSFLNICDFSSTKVLLDVAGGRGRTLATILDLHPHIQGILQELPTVIEAARKFGPLSAPNLAGRCRFVPGNAWEDDLPSADTILIQRVLLGWDDDGVIQMLQRCRNALTLGGRLLVIDSMVEGKGKRDFSTHIDLEMMAFAGGYVRTPEKFEELIKAVGFKVLATTQLSTPLKLIESIIDGERQN